MGRRGMLGDNVVCCEPGTDKTNVSSRGRGEGGQED